MKNGLKLAGKIKLLYFGNGTIIQSLHHNQSLLQKPLSVKLIINMILHLKYPPY